MAVLSTRSAGSVDLSCGGQFHIAPHKQFINGQVKKAPYKASTIASYKAHAKHLIQLLKLLTKLLAQLLKLLTKLLIKLPFKLLTKLLIKLLIKLLLKLLIKLLLKLRIRSLDKVHKEDSALR